MHIYYSYVRLKDSGYIVKIRVILLNFTYVLGHIKEKPILNLNILAFAAIRNIDLYGCAFNT